MEQIATERDLLIALRDAKKRLESLKLEVQDAQAEHDRQEAAIIELLESKQAKATAKYEGIGYASLVKPRLYASYQKDKEEDVFFFLRQSGRTELIRPTVNAQSLSSFIKEMVEAGQNPPDCISYYLKPSVRLYE